MKNQWLIILLIMLFSACSSTLFIKKDEASLKELNEKLEGKEVTARLLNGDEIEDDFKDINGNTLTLEKNKIPTNDVKEIYVKSHGKGFVKGLGYGTLIGLAGPGIIYLCTMNDPYSDVIFLLSPLISLTGGIIGAINGDKDRFIFPIKNKEYKSTINLEISNIIEKRHNSIIIEWKDKVIRLLRSEYKYGKKTKDGKQIIIVPKEVYLEKF